MYFEYICWKFARRLPDRVNAPLSTLLFLSTAGAWNAVGCGAAREISGLIYRQQFGQKSINGSGQSAGRSAMVKGAALETVTEGPTTNGYAGHLWIPWATPGPRGQTTSGVVHGSKKETGQEPAIFWTDTGANLIPTAEMMGARNSLLNFPKTGVFSPPQILHFWTKWTFFPTA